MILDYVGVKEINGSLIVLDDVENASYEEMVDIRLDDGSIRHGRIVQTQGKRCVVQVFEGTKGMSLDNARTRLKGHPMELALSPEIMGRVFNGSGTPIDGLGDIYPTHKANINGTPINPVSRIYPQNYINTGISTIDTLMTLIRGQKLPIFSGSGMKHNELAVKLFVRLRLLVLVINSVLSLQPWVLRTMLRNISARALTKAAFSKELLCSLISLMTQLLKELLHLVVP